MSVSYQRESLSSALTEMSPLFEDHWRELALNQDKIKLAPDVNRYVEMEKSGALHLFTARNNGVLIGYYVSVVQTHPHYANTKCDVSDMFYIVPEHRNGFVGIGLFHYLEKELMLLGVELMMTVIKKSHDIGPMLNYLGWRMSGEIWTKYIG